MNQYLFSKETMSRLKNFSPDDGLEVIVNKLLDLYEDSQIRPPQIKFYPEKLRDEAERIFGKPSDKEKALHKFAGHVELSLTKGDGATTFSRSYPFYDPGKSQSFDWAMRNLTLKRYKERGITECEFRLVKESDIPMPYSDSELKFNSLALSHYLGVKHCDFMRFKPSVSLVLNGYHAYEYRITFPTEERCPATYSPGTEYKINYTKVHSGREGRILIGRKDLQLAFLRKVMNPNTCDFRAMIYIGDDNVHLPPSVKADILEYIRDNYKLLRAFKVAFE